MRSQNVKDRVFIRVLSILSGKEQKGFEDYVLCPVFNTDARLPLCLQLIRTKVLKSKKTVIHENELLKGSKISPRQFAKSCSSLYHLLMEYLELLERRNSKVEPYRHIFQAFARIEADASVIRKEHKRFQKLLDEAPLDVENLHLRFRVEHILGSHTIYRHRKEMADFITDNQGLLDHYYILSKLKYLCGMANLIRHYKREFPDQNQHEFMQLCKKEEQQLPPLGKAYLLTYRILQEQQESKDALDELFELLSSSAPSFAKEDQADLLGYFLNFCLPGIAQGQPYFEEMADRLYQLALQTEAFLAKGKLSPFHFKNIVALRARLGRLEWVHQFILAFKDRLVETYAALTEQFCWGVYHFHTGEKRKAIAIFKEVIRESPEDIFWSLDARNMLWKSYFDLYDTLDIQEFEEMQRLYDSFRLFVARNEKISESYKQNFQNFIRVFNRLLTFLERGTFPPEELQKLKIEAENLEHVTNKKWLVAAIQKFAQ